MDAPCVRVGLSHGSRFPISNAGLSPKSGRLRPKADQDVGMGAGGGLVFAPRFQIWPRALFNRAPAARPEPSMPTVAGSKAPPWEQPRIRMRIA